MEFGIFEFSKFNPRTAGYPPPPLRFFVDSEKTAALAPPNLP